MPRTVQDEIKAEQRGVKGTPTKRGSDDPKGFEHESPEAQAVLLRLFPYLREQQEQSK